MDPYAHVTAPRTAGRGFFATVARGLAMVTVTGLFCGTGIVLYGMRIFDHKTGSLVEVAQETIRSLPELQKNLPPVFADALSDERRPDYIGKLTVSGTLTNEPDRYGRLRPTIVVKNTGDELVSLASMRVVILDDDGHAMHAANVWAATPLAVEDPNWCGPLQPGATRTLTPHVYMGRPDDGRHDKAAKVECEITDLRVWKPRPTGHAEAGKSESVRAESGTTQDEDGFASRRPARTQRRDRDADEN